MNEPATIDQPVTPSEPAPPVEQSDDSLASHEAQFGSGPRPQETDPDAAATRERHRAKSQRATPGDYDQIARWTRELREAEDGLEIPREQGESDRVYQLRRRAEIARMAKKPAASAPAPTVAPPPTAQASVAPAAHAAFTETEPTLEQFADQPDPYSAWQRALARYDRRKDDAERAQREVTERQQRAEQEHSQAEQARVTELRSKWQERIHSEAFMKAHPDYQQKLDERTQIDGMVPPLIGRALLEDDNGPEILYALLSEPSQWDDLVLSTYGKPVDATSVALLRRRFSAVRRPQAVTTGSAVATIPQAQVPRPPNPVRTGPMKTGDELPGDDDSLAAHERAFGAKRRR
jgi:hypothetical protein